MKNKSRIRKMLQDGKIPIGTVVEIGSPELIEVIGNSGYDYVFVDMEHGLYTIETLLNMVRAAEGYGMDTVVRVQYNEPALITQVLDAGAVGVMIPGISTKEDAAKAAEAARYCPDGNRGASPWVRSTGPCLREDETWTDYIQESNREIMLWLTIEGVEGVQNFQDIIRVPGVDVALLGPFDLSQSLGIPGQINHPKIKEAFQEMALEAQKENVLLATVTMINDVSNEAAIQENRDFLNCGGKILCCGCDKGILAARYREILKNVRSAATSQAN